MLTAQPSGYIQRDSRRLSNMLSHVPHHEQTRVCSQDCLDVNGPPVQLLALCCACRPRCCVMLGARQGADTG